MKRNGIFATLTFFTVFLFPALSEAKHIIGGDVTYVCLGEVSPGIKRWRFTIHVYRDCIGGGPTFDQPIQFAIHQGSETNNVLYLTKDVFYNYKALIVPDTPQCVTQIPLVCVEEAIYTFEEDLPVLTNESYFIVYQRCCRNETITNIIGPGDVGATYTIELTPAAMAVNNNSPVYTNFPPIIICNNLPFIFNHSGTDAEGDILVYSFCPALAGGGNPITSTDPFGCDGVIPTPPCPPPFNAVPYTVPDYNFNNPMGGDPQININPVSGEITGTPDLIGQYVVAICVQEYRNGQLLSTVRREFQFNVADCTPDIDAKLSADSLTINVEDYTIKSCGERTIFFQNKTTIAANVKDVEWRFDINGTTVSDNVNKWFTAFTFPDTGLYHGMLLINQNSGGCSDTAFIHVQIYPEVHAGFAYDYDTCVAGPVIFEDHSRGEGGVNQWNWTFGIPGSASNLQNPTFKYPIPGSHSVNLKVVDKNQCTDDTTAVIQWFPVPPVIIIQPNSYLGCVPASIYFGNLSTPIDDSYNIVWYFGDGDSTQNVISPTHVYNEAGVYDVRVEITSPIGCYTEKDFFHLIGVEPAPVANFECDPDSALSNFNNMVRFIDKSSGAARWNWQIGPNFTSTEQNPEHTFQDTGQVTIRLLVTHPLGCIDSMTKELDIRPEITWFMPNAFTPNGDGINDDFFGKGFLNGVTNFKMCIWNRWGEMVFETSNPNDRWNGEKRNSGGMSPEGVYIYTVTFTGPRGEGREFKGFATVVR
ncbi:MAG: PKD domain-containing protein [Saprospiraceae bacterium]|nr:PKD domain-containing protein [Saprospiraceae bacterium]